MAFKIDPDTRRNPKTDCYCIICQRDIKDTSNVMRVNVNWETMEAEQDANGPYHIGPECSKDINSK